MRLILKLLSPLLVFVIAQMTLIAEGVPVPKRHIHAPGKPVNILITGLGGYGENVGADRAVPYFGTLTGLNFAKELEKRGYETYVADIGPMSSEWDRACELYAQLTGTRVDYGAAHSEKYGHERYGRTNKKPLFKGWGPDRPLNLICHSFGGNVARVFALLLDEGSAAERAATPAGELSPLFEGGMIDRLHSITTFANPHNGTTAAGCVSDEHDGEPYLWYALLLNYAGRNHTVNGVYDLQLEHFGMSIPPAGWGWPWPSYDIAKKFLESRDHAFYGCSLDGAAALNRIDRIRPSVYYFSYSSTITLPVGGEQLPHPREYADPVLFWWSIQVGRGTGWIASPGPEWLVNDGLVPLPSALYPEGQPHREFTPGKTEVLPGVWNVMPTLQNADHAYWCGGDALRHNPREVFGIYLELMERLEGTY